MNKSFRRLIATLISTTLVLSSIYVPAFAADPSDQMTWSELQELINDGDDKLITLNSDVTAGPGDGPLTVPDNVDVSINLDGYTISRNLSEATSRGNVFVVEDNASLTIAGYGGTITGGNTTGNGGGIFNKGFLYLESNITFISNHAVDDGGAVYNAQSGILYMSGVYFISNSAGRHGGALAGGGEVTDSYSSYRNNTASTDGGAIWHSSNDTLTVNSGEFTGNSAGRYGGAVCVALGDSVFDYCRITGNSADMGGGMYFESSTNNRFTFDITVTDNTATSSGGGIMARSNANLTFDAATHINNNKVNSKASNLALERNTTAHIGGDFTSDSMIGLSITGVTLPASAPLKVVDGLDNARETIGSGCFSVDDNSLSIAIQDDGSIIMNTAATVSFNTTGGKGSMSAVKVPVNSEYTLPGSGFTGMGTADFRGWKVPGHSDWMSSGDSLKITGNTTLTAMYKLMTAYVDQYGNYADTVDCWVITSDTTELKNGEWYAVAENVTIFPRLTVSGNVNIILCDGAKMTNQSGIQVENGNQLSIWAQSGGTGSINAYIHGQYGNLVAGIGGDNDCGTIRIYGGNISGKGNGGGAGIGGGTRAGFNPSSQTSGHAGNILIAGGNVTAYGSTGNGSLALGGYSQGTVTITGGHVVCEGVLGDLIAGRNIMINLSYDDNDPTRMSVTTHAVNGNIHIIKDFSNRADQSAISAGTYSSGSCIANKTIVPATHDYTAWEDMQTSINTASSGDTIVLHGDVIGTSYDNTPLIIPSGKTLTIDLNGYVINRYAADPVSDGNAITVKGVLTLKDSKGGGYICGGNSSGLGGGITVKDGGRFILEGGKITNNMALNGSGIGCDKNSTVELRGGMITYNSAKDSGGGLFNEGTASLTGNTVITNNSATRYHGGGICNLGKLNLQGSPVISNNTVADLPNNLQLHNDTLLTITGSIGSNVDIGITRTSRTGKVTSGLASYGSISNFHSDNTEYVAALNPDGEVVIGAQCKVDFDANGGEGVMPDDEAVTLTSYTIPGCGFTAPDGLYFTGWTCGDTTVYPGCTLIPAGDITLVASWGSAWESLQAKINGSQDGEVITLDKTYKADSSNSALYIPESKNVVIDLNGYSIDRDLEAAVDCGYVIAVDGKLTIQDSGKSGTVTGGNTTGVAGGVRVNAGGFFELKSGSITGNCADGGAGIHNSGTTTISGGSITGNVSGSNGGGIYNSGTLNLFGGTITGNSADVEQRQGGGIYQAGTLNMQGSPVVTGNTAADGNNIRFKGGHQGINITGDLAPEAKVGVVTATKPSAESDTFVFTNGLSGRGSIDNFFSDEDYLIISKDGEAALYSGSYANLKGLRLSLEGDIGVIFYMQLSDDIAQSGTAYMKFTLPGGTDTVKVSDATTEIVEGVNCYVFKCHVSAKNMNSTIKAQLFDDSITGTEYAYTVKKYAEYILAHASESTEYADAVPLVKAMLNYGTAAQVYFKVNEEPANATPYMTDEDRALNVTASDITAPSTVISLDDLDGVTFEGASVSLRSEMTLSLYFKSDKELTFSCGDMTVDKVTSSDGYQVARIRGIKANEIGDLFTLNIACGDKSGSMKYSALTYCRAILDGDYDTKLQDAVKALYLYYQAAL